MEQCVWDEFIERTLKPVYEIKLTDDETTPYNSKVGGVPYWPEGQNVEELQFLAQINFEELPNNTELPKKGMLQFFIGNDEWLGLDLLRKESKFKVIYHKNIGETTKPNLPESEYTPILKPGRMVFRKYMEPMSCEDWRFPFDIEDTIADKRVLDIEDVYGCGSKILGYPDFAQYDPRTKNGLQKYDTLLLQLDSWGNDCLMWGDSGIGNFFISGEALKKANFSDILYNFDCC